MTPAVPRRTFNPDQNSPERTGEHNPMSNDQPAPLVCPSCRAPMQLMRTIPRLGALPEIFVFYCARCQQAETIVQERAA
jgi:hypothetical protein